jgi:hypothetical protein
MASPRRIAANRLNARKSTGPRTAEGKRRSRRNALRHGLTAETVIDVYECSEDYVAFQRQLLRALKPHSAIEQELAGRLVSLLWRLRRAIAIESGLIDIHTRASRSKRPFMKLPTDTRYSLQSNVATLSARLEKPLGDEMSATDLAHTFSRLSNLSPEIWDRLRRYETSLWRQAAQIILILGPLRSEPRQDPPVPED